MIDLPPCDDVCAALETHVRRYFVGHDIDVFGFSAGPIARTNRHFRALRIAPAQGHPLWHYVSTGGWAETAGDNYGIEFIVATPFETTRAVELLAMNVYYHGAEGLGLGHTLPIGEPWLPGSICDHLLVSLPYPYGPELQICDVGDRQVDFVWLLPITQAERDFKAAHDVQALEQRFEEAGLRYWEIERSSVI